MSQLQGELPPGIELVKADDFTEWFMDIKVIDENPLYQGEVYRLKFSFSGNYPIEVHYSNLLPLYARSPSLV
jgi:ubiquitin-conjugating enzyme E2 W